MQTGGLPASSLSASTLHPSAALMAPTAGPGFVTTAAAGTGVPGMSMLPVPATTAATVLQDRLQSHYTASTSFGHRNPGLGGPTGLPPPALMGGHILPVTRSGPVPTAWPTVPGSAAAMAVAASPAVTAPQLAMTGLPLASGQQPTLNEAFFVQPTVALRPSAHVAMSPPGPSVPPPPPHPLQQPLSALQPQQQQQSPSRDFEWPIRTELARSLPREVPVPTIPLPPPAARRLPGHVVTGFCRRLEENRVALALEEYNHRCTERDLQEAVAVVRRAEQLPKLQAPVWSYLDENDVICGPYSLMQLMVLLKGAPQTQVESSETGESLPFVEAIAATPLRSAVLERNALRERLVALEAGVWRLLTEGRALCLEILAAEFSALADRLASARWLAAGMPSSNALTPSAVRSRLIEGALAPDAALLPATLAGVPLATFAARGALVPATEVVAEWEGALHEAVERKTAAAAARAELQDTPTPLPQRLEGFRAPEEEKAWTYVSEGRPAGPCSALELHAWLEAGMLDCFTLLASERRKVQESQGQDGDGGTGGDAPKWLLAAEVMRLYGRQGGGSAPAPPMPPPPMPAPPDLLFGLKDSRARDQPPQQQHAGQHQSQEQHPQQPPGLAVPPQLLQVRPQLHVQPHSSLMQSVLPPRPLLPPVAAMAALAAANGPVPPGVVAPLAQHGGHMPMAPGMPPLPLPLGPMGHLHAMGGNLHGAGPGVSAGGLEAPSGAGPGMMGGAAGWSEDGGGRRRGSMDGGGGAGWPGLAIRNSRLSSQGSGMLRQSMSGPNSPPLPGSEDPDMLQRHGSVASLPSLARSASFGGSAQGSLMHPQPQQRQPLQKRQRQRNRPSASPAPHSNGQTSPGDTFRPIQQPPEQRPTPPGAPLARPQAEQLPPPPPLPGKLIIRLGPESQLPPLPRPPAASQDGAEPEQRSQERPATASVPVVGDERAPPAASPSTTTAASPATATPAPAPPPPAQSALPPPSLPPTAPACAARSAVAASTRIPSPAARPLPPPPPPARQAPALAAVAPAVSVAKATGPRAPSPTPAAASASRAPSPTSTAGKAAQPQDAAAPEAPPQAEPMPAALPAEVSPALVAQSLRMTKLQFLQHMRPHLHKLLAVMVEDAYCDYRLRLLEELEDRREGTNGPQQPGPAAGAGADESAGEGRQMPGSAEGRDPGAAGRPESEGAHAAASEAATRPETGSARGAEAGASGSEAAGEERERDEGEPSRRPLQQGRTAPQPPILERLLVAATAEAGKSDAPCLKPSMPPQPQDLPPRSESHQLTRPQDEASGLGFEGPDVPQPPRVPSDTGSPGVTAVRRQAHEGQRLPQEGKQQRADAGLEPGRQPPTADGTASRTVPEAGQQAGDKPVEQAQRSKAQAEPLPSSIGGGAPGTPGLSPEAAADSASPAPAEASPQPPTSPISTPAKSAAGRSRHAGSVGGGGRRRGAQAKLAAPAALTTAAVAEAPAGGHSGTSEGSVAAVGQATTGAGAVPSAGAEPVGPSVPTAGSEAMAGADVAVGRETTGNDGAAGLPAVNEAAAGTDAEAGIAAAGPSPLVGTPPSGDAAVEALVTASADAATHAAAAAEAEAATPSGTADVTSPFGKAAALGGAVREAAVAEQRTAVTACTAGGPESGSVAPAAPEHKGAGGLATMRVAATAVAEAGVEGPGAVSRPDTGPAAEAAGPLGSAAATASTAAGGAGNAAAAPAATATPTAPDRADTLILVHDILDEILMLALFTAEAQSLISAPSLRSTRSRRQQGSSASAAVSPRATTATGAFGASAASTAAKSTGGKARRPTSVEADDSSAPAGAQQLPAKRQRQASVPAGAGASASAGAAPAAAAGGKVSEREAPEAAGCRSRKSSGRSREGRDRRQQGHDAPAAAADEPGSPRKEPRAKSPERKPVPLKREEENQAKSPDRKRQSLTKVEEEAVAKPVDEQNQPLPQPKREAVAQLRSPARRKRLPEVKRREEAKDAMDTAAAAAEPAVRAADADAEAAAEAQARASPDQEPSPQPLPQHARSGQQRTRLWPWPGRRPPKRARRDAEGAVSSPGDDEAGKAEGSDEDPHDEPPAHERDAHRDGTVKEEEGKEDEPRQRRDSAGGSAEPSPGTGDADDAPAEAGTGAGAAGGEGAAAAAAEPRQEPSPSPRPPRPPRHRGISAKELRALAMDSHTPMVIASPSEDAAGLLVVGGATGGAGALEALLLARGRRTRAAAAAAAVNAGAAALAAEALASMSEGGAGAGAPAAGTRASRTGAVEPHEARPPHHHHHQRSGSRSTPAAVAAGTAPELSAQQQQQRSPTRGSSEATGTAAGAAGVTTAAAAAAGQYDDDTHDSASPFKAGSRAGASRRGGSAAAALRSPRSLDNLAAQAEIESFQAAAAARRDSRRGSDGDRRAPSRTSSCTQEHLEGLHSAIFPGEPYGKAMRHDSLTMLLEASLMTFAGLTAGQAAVGDEPAAAEPPPPLAGAHGSGGGPALADQTTAVGGDGDAADEDGLGCLEFDGGVPCVPKHARGRRSARRSAVRRNGAGAAASGLAAVLQELEQEARQLGQEARQQRELELQLQEQQQLLLQLQQQVLPAQSVSLCPPLPEPFANVHDGQAPPVFYRLPPGGFSSPVQPQPLAASVAAAPYALNPDFLLLQPAPPSQPQQLQQPQAVIQQLLLQPLPQQAQPAPAYLAPVPRPKRRAAQEAAAALAASALDATAEADIAALPWPDAAAIAVSVASRTRRRGSGAATPPLPPLEAPSITAPGGRGCRRYGSRPSPMIPGGAANHGGISTGPAASGGRARAPTPSSGADSGSELSQTQRERQRQRQEALALLEGTAGCARALPLPAMLALTSSRSGAAMAAAVTSAAAGGGGRGRQAATGMSAAELPPHLHPRPRAAASEHRFLTAAAGGGSSTGNGGGGGGGSSAEQQQVMEVAKWRQLASRAKKLKFGRSRIAGWGLFAVEPIEPSEFVMEYCGEVIRKPLDDVRQRQYDAAGYADYMFAVDESRVVDATLTGNPARFINHCCDPNCAAKVVEVGGERRIAIYSVRRIEAGEELHYDYKLSCVPGTERIPCGCGARNCKGFMN